MQQYLYSLTDFVDPDPNPWALVPDLTCPSPREVAGTVVVSLAVLVLQLGWWGGLWLLGPAEPWPPRSAAIRAAYWPVLSLT